MGGLRCGWRNIENSGTVMVTEPQWKRWSCDSVNGSAVEILKRQIAVGGNILVVVAGTAAAVAVIL